MILDNARIHHAKLLGPILGENPRLKLVFLPPYSPKMNLIEGLWGWLKKDVINNVFFSSVKQIRRAVQEFIGKINEIPDTVVNRLCVQM
jgi:putative transposase